MNLESLREYCLAKKGVEETLPFGPETLVYKVMGKMFLLTGFEYNPVQYNVKCDPERAISLRESYSCILPAYHMNKTHWNTVVADGTLSQKQQFELIDHSYNLVVASLTKRLKAELEQL